MQFFILPAYHAGQWTKEERAGYNPAELPRKKNLRKKNLRKKKLPARIVEQAGVPIDRVIGLSGYRVIEKTNLNRPYMVDAILVLVP